MTLRADISAGNRSGGDTGSRYPRNEDRRRFSLWLDEREREALDLLAARNERPVAAEIRQAVRERIEREAAALRNDEGALIRRPADDHADGARAHERP